MITAEARGNADEILQSSPLERGNVNMELRSNIRVGEGCVQNC